MNDENKLRVTAIFEVERPEDVEDLYVWLARAATGLSSIVRVAGITEDDTNPPIRAKGIELTGLDAQAFLDEHLD